MPVMCLRLPSRVRMSITEEILPPNSAPKPPVYTSAEPMMSLSKTENRPMEWKGL